MPGLVRSWLSSVTLKDKKGRKCLSTWCSGLVVCGKMIVLSPSQAMALTDLHPAHHRAAGAQGDGGGSPAAGERSGRGHDHHHPLCSVGSAGCGAPPCGVLDLSALVNCPLSSPRYVAQLYHRISKIEWDYECQPGMVKGSIL